MTTRHGIYIAEHALADVTNPATGQQLLIFDATTGKLALKRPDGSIRYVLDSEGYDTNNDGTVHAADAVPWGGVTGKPATFPPSSHDHPAADIVSGTIAAARLPAASTSAAGIVRLASSGTTTATYAVTGSDERLQYHTSFQPGVVTSMNVARLSAASSMSYIMTFLHVIVGNSTATWHVASMWEVLASAHYSDDGHIAASRKYTIGDTADGVSWAITKSSTRVYYLQITTTVNYLTFDVFAHTAGGGAITWYV